MTGMPASFACCSTVIEVEGSMSVMIRTLTFSWIMPCAMLWNLVLSPSAFWMSALMPASWNAFCSAGRSAVSQRVDDWVSGRITPTVPLAVPPPPLLDDGAALLLLPPVDAEVDAAGELEAREPVFLLLLHPAMPRPATAATAASRIAVLFMQVPFGSRARSLCPAGRPVVVRHNICTTGPRRKRVHGSRTVRNASVT